MKHSTKTDRQRVEHERYLQHKLAWKISLQYSKILNDNINKSNVLETVPDIYFQYIQSLRSNRLINIGNRVKNTLP